MGPRLERMRYLAAMARTSWVMSSPRVASHGGASCARVASSGRCIGREFPCSINRTTARSALRSLSCADDSAADDSSAEVLADHTAVFAPAASEVEAGGAATSLAAATRGMQRLCNAHGRAQSWLLAIVQEYFRAG